MNMCREHAIILFFKKFIIILTFHVETVIKCMHGVYGVCSGS